MSVTAPAALGGEPAFAQRLPLMRPTPPQDPEALNRRLTAILDSGLLTNGPTVRELEETVAQRLGVAAVVAVSSCTSGLMLVLQALGATGRVLMPSFTFAASGHAVVWAGGSPVWADVDLTRCTVDPADAADRAQDIVAMTATHTFGAPCQTEALQQVADAAGVPLIYDAAHGLGSSRAGRPVGGFGTAEVFSLSPTKVVYAGEGGLVATGDPALADTIRLGRDYGNPGTYDCVFPGLNARMSELHAAVGLASLVGMDERIEHRNLLVNRVRNAFADTPGVQLQRLDEGDVSTYKDLTLLLDSDEHGVTPEVMTAALAAEGVDTRRYYTPPLHQQEAYRQVPQQPPLPATEALCRSVITLPLWSHMTAATIDTVTDLCQGILTNGHAIAAAVRDHADTGHRPGEPGSRKVDA